MAVDLAAVGALNLDSIYRVRDGEGLNRILDGRRPGGEYVLAANEEAGVRESIKRYADLLVESGGGQAGNFAAAARKLGLNCVLAARVGDDAAGDFLLSELDGVDLSQVRRSGTSGRCLIILNAEGDRTIFVSPGANDELTINDLDAKRLFAARWLMMTSFVGDGPLNAQAELMRLLPGDAFVAFDPGELYARRGEHPACETILKRAELLLVNEAEAEMMTGRKALEAAEVFLDLGPRIVVIKRGAAGALIWTAKDRYEIPAVETRVVDTTGAGDVFAAAFLAGLIRRFNLLESGRFAALAAALSISGRGRESYPNESLWAEFNSRRNL